MASYRYFKPLKAGQGNGICAAAAMQQELGLSNEEVAEFTGYSLDVIYHTLHDKYSLPLERKLLLCCSERYKRHIPEDAYCHIELDESELHFEESPKIDFTGGFFAYVNFMRYKHGISITKLSKQTEFSPYTLKSLIDGELVLSRIDDLQRPIEEYFRQLEKTQPSGAPNANRGLARYKLTLL